MKKYVPFVISAVVLAAVLAFMYFSIPHAKPTPISEVLKNPDLYRAKTFMIEGKPLIRYSLDTPYGSVYYYSLKDSTGQIPIHGDTQGLEALIKSNHPDNVGFVGTLGDICVHGFYNATSDKVICDRKELGMST